MAYSKYITNEGKNQILKLAFLNKDINSFSYCALAQKGTALASQTHNSTDFNELNINSNNYQRAPITQVGDVENQTLTVSCTFKENNYNAETGVTIAEIGLCDDAESATPTYFAFSEVPEIEKTGSVSLKYTWIIKIQ